MANGVSSKSYRIDEKKLEQIAEKHSLGAIRTVHYSEEGLVNPCLFLNDELVLRVNTRDPQEPKFRREKIAMQLLAATSVPVPEVVALDESKDILQYDYLITSRIEGESLGKRWFSLPGSVKARLVEQAGGYLAKIHEVETTSFGDVSSDNFGTHSQWGAYLAERAKRYTESVVGLGAISEDDAARVTSILQQWRPKLDLIRTSNLIHGDFHFGNILFSGTEITGILDFEWCGAADKDFEFRNYSEMFGKREGYEPYLLGAYFAEHNRSEDFATKLVLYRLVWRLQLLEVAFMHWEERLRKLIFDQVVDLLNQAEIDAP